MVKNNYCTVCGIPEKACLHHLQKREEKRDLRVTRICWFAVGFLTAMGMLLIEIGKV